MKAFLTHLHYPFLMALTLIYSSLHAQNRYTEWTSPISGSGGAIVTSSITLDEEENVFAVGTFLDSIEATTINNGSVKLISKGKTDMFVAKINPQGALVWIKQVGGKDFMGSTGTNIDFYQDPFLAIVSDKNGNLYISGHYRDSVDFDPGAGQYFNTSLNASTSNSFILALDKEGAFKWVRTLYGGNNVAQELAIDRNKGTLYVTGHFTDNVDFNNRTGVNIIAPTRVGRGSQDIFIAKYDTLGTFLWAKPIGGGSRPSVNEGIGIHVDKDGYVYTTGIFRDSIYFDANRPGEYLLSWGSGTGFSSNSSVFALKLDPDGKYIWAKCMGALPNTGTGNSRGSAITTDSKGNVYTTGYFQGEASFDPQNRTPIPSIFGNGITFFLSKLDPSGNFLWQKSLERPAGANSVDNGFSVATDDEDNIHVAGYFGSRIYLDPDRSATGREVFEAIGGTSSLIIKLDKDGNYIWGKKFHTDPGTNRTLKVLATSKNLYACGYFNNITNFSPSGLPQHDSVQAAKNHDGFIVKMNCPGTHNDIVVEQCGEGYELNGILYEETGIYTQTFKNQLGCDSIFQLDLTVKPFTQAHITVDGFVLGTTVSFSTYQWMLNGELIPGATTPKYEVKENGRYQVIVVSENGCTDTSDVYQVNNADGSGIAGVKAMAHQIRIAPNPAKDRVHIIAPIAVSVAVYSVEGRLIRQVNNTRQLDIQALPKGFYLIKIYDFNGELLKSEKLIKSE